MQLMYDADVEIKVLAIDSIVEILDVLSHEFKKEKLLSVIIDLMSSSNEAVQKRMSFHFGQIVY